MREVVVLIGAGSIGQAIARRVGAGRQVVIADLRVDAAESAARTFRDAGFTVTAAQIDVSSRPSVEALASHAAALGPVLNVIHAAGVSPSQAPVATILAVDLYGTALVLEAFGREIASGGAGGIGKNL
ncbi:NAD(P)-dependent dehydrogenase (short-subunit alcohol dehydrogenase family) [Novosphingobium capsulatum]|uniref:NAD(P)-dependent dehydrogenase (Short-subunit alcohol dehydrogenase family) n=1 Tax=Novosphingobium capsulatum TaxID=13688 RepID=A0ABU1MSF0_9SPHN|nr:MULTISPECIES: SDR family NAD(P)-dependent oxidoreductase [Novosphingobium]MBB3357993.1 NAD(P)-dependent dehydrogenase (short-subunit alcohol dehydrogenase family) [Novosphingobium sp. BK256]MBB3374354.1 NAD(P)-dependent dehydrogenase (short-subunit alcohol dehydrogenase family) [Novosphingobium sp. BK280]MBB3378766.1 NAD(P)-dependent dehydrogenase (short-subunit alcohol dehydrogenase family) [Novosphingobium sp. BK258]MBB3420460.1 NAD(P)-dependent dehydrogenase (short-subunit alcohol dehydro